MRIMILDRRKLSRYRIKSGKSIRKLAREANVNPATIVRMEKGESNPNPATARSVCEALAVDFDTIFTIKEE